ncbi:MAG: hypothetical protein ACTSRA_01710 [Promethearchaeota archaeon]
MKSENEINNADVQPFKKIQANNKKLASIFDNNKFKICPKCGFRNIKELDFCINCAHALSPNKSE